MDFSVDFLSKLTDIKILHEMQHFDTFEDIIWSNLTVYSYDQIEGEVNDVNLKKLISKTKIIANANDCVRKLVESKNVICMTSYRRAVAELHNVGASALVKIAKPTFDNYCEVFSYEKASPFFERLEEILQRIIESGISYTSQFHQQKSNRNSRIDNESNDTQSILGKELAFILFIGCLLSTLVFIFELLWSRISLPRKKKTKGRIVRIQRIRFGQKIEYTHCWKVRARGSTLSTLKILRP